MADKEKVINLKVDSKTAQANVEELNKSFEAQVDLIDDLEKDLIKYESTLSKTSKTDLAGRKRVNDAITETKNRLKEEKGALKSLNIDKKKANTQLKEATANQREYGGVLGYVDKMTGGAISGIRNMIGAISGATKGFNLMKIAIIGTGIGALVVAVGSLIAAFKSSEEGQNKFSKLMGVIGSVVGNVIDLFANLGEGIISVFENPKKAIIDFTNLIKTNITNRFESILETVGFLGEAFKKVFSGDFAGAMEDAKKAGSSYVDTFTGVKNTIDKVGNSVKNLTNDFKNDADSAAKIADQRAKADKLSRDLIVSRAEAERKIADLREKAADKENFTAKQRIDFLKEAGDINNDLANKEIEISKIRLSAKQAENSLSKSNKEALDEEAQLKADLISKETQRLKLQKALTAELTTASREGGGESGVDDAAAQKKIDEAKALNDKLLEEQDKFYDELADKAEDRLQQEAEGEDYKNAEKLRTAEDERISAMELLDQSREAELISQAEFNERKLALEAEYNATVDEVAEERKAQEDEKLLETREAQLETDAYWAEQSVELAEQEAEQKRRVQEQYLNFLGGIGGILSDIAGENEALATASLVLEKGAAIAGVVISAQQSIATRTATNAAIPAFLPIPSAIPIPNPAKILDTVGMVKDNAMTKVGAGISIASIAATALKGGKKSASGVPNGGGASGGGGLGVSTTKLSEFQESNFDAVGNEQSRGESQAVQNSNAQSNNPIQAYVTSSNVSTAAALERNRVDVSGF